MISSSEKELLGQYARFAKKRTDVRKQQGQMLLMSYNMSQWEVHNTEQYTFYEWKIFVSGIWNLGCSFMYSNQLYQKR